MSLPDSFERQLLQRLVMAVDPNVACDCPPDALPGAPACGYHRERAAWMVREAREVVADIHDEVRRLAEESRSGEVAGG